MELALRGVQHLMQALDESLHLKNNSEMQHWWSASKSRVFDYLHTGVLLHIDLFNKSVGQVGNFQFMSDTDQSDPTQLYIGGICLEYSCFTSLRERLFFDFSLTGE